nr:MAG TPA: hypothetical protein [Caudoviricetes sp.]
MPELVRIVFLPTSTPWCWSIPARLTFVLLAPS